MLAKVLSAAVVGLDAVPVTVEVDVSSGGLPSFTIVGLPDKAVEESRERVRAALKNTGAEFPPRKIIVNLAPADLPKAGPIYDLPIALGILIASGQLPALTKKAIFIGEMSLDGSLRHTNGVLPLSILAQKKGIKRVYLPAVDAREAAVVRGLAIYPVASLLTLFHHFSNLKKINFLSHISFATIKTHIDFDFDLIDIQGQEQAKRAFEIAAAGGHNLYMQGPPGAGKTMLARTLPSILPILTEKEALEVTKIYSITGNLPQGESIIKHRPFRSPHHTTSRIGLIGGGANPMPGEISLSHRGVLFLDEFPEFPRHVLEALRQPLEDGFVSISRAKATVKYPAKFILIAAANPCPCGNFGVAGKTCKCLPGHISRYTKKISGPLIDRIDLHITVPPVKVEKLTGRGEKNQISSVEIQKKVQMGRDLQNVRYSNTPFSSNAELTTRGVKQFINLSEEVRAFLRQAVSRLGLSARSYYKIIKVSKTISDLAREKEMNTSHVAEALQYRPKDQD